MIKSRNNSVIAIYTRKQINHVDESDLDNSRIEQIEYAFNDYFIVEYIPERLINNGTKSIDNR